MSSKSCNRYLQLGGGGAVEAFQRIIGGMKLSEKF